MTIGKIGFTDDTALLCHTNNPPCDDSGTSGGDWFGPNGSRVLGKHEHNGVPGFMRDRGPNVVRLKRSPSTIQHEGVYKCVIQDDTFVNQTVYVRLNGMCNNYTYCTIIIMKSPVFTHSICFSHSTTLTLFHQWRPSCSN